MKPTRIRVSLDIAVNREAWGHDLTGCELAAVVRSYLMDRLAQSDAVLDRRIISVAPATPPRIHMAAD